MKYQQLTEGQRYQISLLREDNLSCSEIVIRIGVSKSTVSREVRRNWTAGGELYKHLRQGKRRYRRGYGQKRGRHP